MKTLTIFCHGTAQHRSNFGEGPNSPCAVELLKLLCNHIMDSPELSAFYSRARPRDMRQLHEYKHFCLELDGPGSAPPNAALYPAAIRPGSFHADDVMKTPKSTKTFPGQLRCMLTGHGWDENVTYAIRILTKLRESNIHIERVNLVGWSRGAITAIKIANAIEQYNTTKSAHTDVNIFAIDPVNGPFRRGDNTHHSLPNCVKHFVATIMTHSGYPAGFSPMHKSALRFNAYNTKVVYQVMPGKHDSPVFHSLRAPQDRIKPEEYVSEIIFSTVYAHLKEWGSAVCEIAAQQYLTLDVDKIGWMYDFIFRNLAWYKRNRMGERKVDEYKLSLSHVNWQHYALEKLRRDPFHINSVNILFQTYSQLPIDSRKPRSCIVGA